MKWKTTTIAFLLWAVVFLPALAAQEGLYMPKEFHRAYQTGTRSYDGRPGPNYWQNTADYTIEVTLDPERKKVTGSEKVVFHNNSPDRLTTLCIRFYGDVYKKNSARSAAVPPEDVIDGIELTRLAIDGKDYDAGKIRASIMNTNLILALDNPLPAGGKLTLEAEWSQLIPLAVSRGGYADATSFFVAYWYPQIAVYDDVFGWDDRLGFNLVSEFYNNLANFDVTIHAPETFTVWATGELQNETAVLPPPIRQRLAQARAGEQTTSVLTAEDLGNGYRNLSGAWHYRAEQVTDFAFAASDHYLWDAATLKVDGRNVLISSVYPAAKAEAMKDNTPLQMKAIRHFSEDFPGVPYPYPAYTAFIGLPILGGMEFPMMANNAGPSRLVAVHELFHMYFPMYVRTNEKRFSWMDEGWAEYVSSLVIARYFENDYTPQVLDYKRDLKNTIGSFTDLPLMAPSQMIDQFNGSYSAYHLPAFLYGTLHHHLGEDLFLKCLQEYIRRWAYKES